ncbi:HepT-like ribonuclease domain-containing protein [Roseiarcus fermentans]|uniref:HepT-like ribonuclease domain-containing protein n=1 Tax=Roseiarcus fermentans TaxID=1473586 RepID=UPI001FDFB5FB|nr:HepT-like ribonuclease domain-containing protein [Roseiarcus fermentans]
MRSDRSGSIAYLFHIRDNIVLARHFVEGLDYERFRADPLRVYAVTRALEIISEASRRLPETTKQRHAGIPWPDIAGAGNVYVYGRARASPLANCPEGLVAASGRRGTGIARSRRGAVTFVHTQTRDTTACEPA